MSLQNDILTAWSRAQNEHERDLILREIEAARHEIRIEYLWSEPELRWAIASLESNLTAIMRGQYGVAEVCPWEADGGQRVAPLVGIAGYIAMLLALRAEHRARMHRELQGSCVHACRIDEAQKARAHPARPINGCTGYVCPVGPLAVACPICGAGKGVRCSGGEGQTDR